MMYLRQSTASQSVLIGPFVDSTDGNTAETGLTVANTDIRLSKNGGNMAAKNSGGGTHDELGYYTITLDATDTDTVGRLQLAVHVAGALPVYHTFQVMEEAAFDALYAASAAPATAAAQATAQSDLDILTGADGVIIASGTQTFNMTGNITGNMSGSVGSVTGDINTATGTITTLDGLENVSAAQVNAEVVDVLSVDTFAEPTGVPPATDTITNKLGRLYMALRNRVDITATKKTFFDDTDASEWEHDLTDDGTTFSQSEANSI